MLWESWGHRRPLQNQDGWRRPNRHIRREREGPEDVRSVTSSRRLSLRGTIGCAPADGLCRSLRTDCELPGKERNRGEGR